MAAPPTSLLGTGIMGSRMAARLVAAGMPLTVWNRDPAKAAPLGARGARIAPGSAEAVRGAAVVILMLADAAAVESVLWERGAAEALAPGSVVVDMGSIAPAAARDHAGRLAARGVAHIDAPVSGGARGAEDGSLTIMAGGEREAFAAARPVLEHLGRATLIGPSGSGQVAKAANQLIVGVTIGAVAEALLLAETAGVDPAAVRDALAGGFADSRILREHGARMVTGDHVPGAHVATQLKDMGTIAGLAAETGTPTPLADRVTELYRSLRDHFGPDLDHSALILELRRRREAGS
jgi:2-hydroxy-3-oxopropionate reductase